MEFGLFMELSVPRPWTADSERQVYENALEQVRLADELGFDYVWAVEHHFLEEYSHCSGPDIFLSAAAAQTKRIRIGHGVIPCVPQYQSPIRVAERAAVLDIISGGRLELGTGRSATWPELSGFGADPDETKKTWDEFVRVIPKMWMQERFAWDGRMFSMPERAILPKPLQKPHPPMWVAVTSPGTEVDAADRGLGCLGLSPGGFADSEKKVANYRHRIQTCDPVGAFVNEKVLTVNFLSCCEDGDLGRRNGLKVASMFSYMAAQLLSAKEVLPTHSYPSEGLLPALAARVGQPRRRRQGLQGRHDGHARRRRGCDRRLGERRVRRHQLHPPVHGGGAPAVRARFDAPLRRGGHAPLQDGLVRSVVVPARRGGGGLMPLAGSLDIRPLLAGAPEVTLDDRQLKVDDVDILQVLYEVRVADRESLVPPALNPTIPPVISFLVYRARESVYGPFALAQLRLTARSGVRPRAYLISARCDNAGLAEVLEGSWGFRIAPGAISLRRFHDRVDCAVREEDGRTILETSLVDPFPVTGHDVQYPPGMHLARVTRDGVSKPRIVQVDSEYEFRRADRGRPEVTSFDPEAWGDARLVPDLPVSASFAACDMTIANVRYICNPDIPAAEGTEKVSET